MKMEDIKELVKDLTAMSNTQLLASTEYQYIRKLLKAWGEMESKKRELWDLERTVELFAIGVKAKEQEGYSLRNSYNDGYKDGKNGKFERKSKHPEVLIDQKEDNK